MTFIVCFTSTFLYVFKNLPFGYIMRDLFRVSICCAHRNSEFCAPVSLRWRQFKVGERASRKWMTSMARYILICIRFSFYILMRILLRKEFGLVLHSKTIFPVGWLRAWPNPVSWNILNLIYSIQIQMKCAIFKFTTKYKELLLMFVVQ